VKTVHNQTARDRNYFRCRKVPFNTDTLQYGSSGLQIIRTVKYFLVIECCIIPGFRLKGVSLYKLTEQISAAGSQIRGPGIHGEVINYQVHDPS
jgi:hypothetical protein